MASYGNRARGGIGPAGPPGAGTSAFTEYLFDNMVADGVTDNLAIWNTGISTLLPSIHDVCDAQLPPGDLFFSNTINLIRRTTLYGTGGSVTFPGSRLIFPRTIEGPGIVMHSHASSGGLGRTEGSWLFNFGLKYGAWNLGAYVWFRQWFPNLTPVLNETYVPWDQVMYDHGIAYKAIAVAGPTAATPPAWYNRYPFEGPVSGCTNTTPIVISHYDPITLTGTAHGRQTGDKVDISGVQGCTAANGTNWTITVLSPTTFSLDGSVGNGAWVTGTGNWRLSNIQDGGVTWKWVAAHGVDVKDQFCRIEHLNIAQWPGAGVNCTGGAFYKPVAMSSHTSVFRCFFGALGHSGFMSWGGDSNIIHTSGCTATDNRGHAIRDGSEIRNKHEMWHAAYNQSCAYFCSNPYNQSGGAVFDNCYDEMGKNDPPNLIAHPAVWKEGTPTTNFTGRHPWTVWAPGVTYPPGSVVKPTAPNATGYVYRYDPNATVNGVSGATEPAWPTRHLTLENPVDTDTVDGTVTWYTYARDVYSGGDIRAFGISSSTTYQKLQSDGQTVLRFTTLGDRPGSIAAWTDSRDGADYSLNADSSGVGWQALLWAGDHADGAAFALSTDRAVAGGTARRTGQFWATGDSHYIGKNGVAKIEVATGNAVPAGTGWTNAVSWNSSYAQGGVDHWRAYGTSSWDPIYGRLMKPVEVSDAAHAAALATAHIIHKVALTANRAITLPALTAVPEDFEFHVTDFTLTAAFAIQATPDGTDKINNVNATTTVITCGTTPSTKRIRKLSNALGWAIL